jgi:hypothetical protein
MNQEGQREGSPADRLYPPGAANKWTTTYFLFNPVVAMPALHCTNRSLTMKEFSACAQ